MQILEEDKCECGGDLRLYNGALGYQSMECQECGHHWDATNEDDHNRQVSVYNLASHVATLTHVNYHTEARQEIASFLGHTGYCDVFNYIAEKQEQKGFLSEELNHMRNYATRLMLEEFGRKFGDVATNKIKGAL